jgi:hypothetical protein
LRRSRGCFDLRSRLRPCAPCRTGRCRFVEPTVLAEADLVRLVDLVLAHAEVGRSRSSGGPRLHAGAVGLQGRMPAQRPVRANVVVVADEGVEQLWSSDSLRAGSCFISRRSPIRSRLAPIGNDLESRWFQPNPRHRSGGGTPRPLPEQPSLRLEAAPHTRAREAA